MLQIVITYLQKSQRSQGRFILKILLVDLVYRHLFTDLMAGHESLTR